MPATIRPPYISDEAFAPTPVRKQLALTNLHRSNGKPVSPSFPLARHCYEITMIFDISARSSPLAGQPDRMRKSPCGGNLSFIVERHTAWGLRGAQRRGNPSPPFFEIFLKFFLFPREQRPGAQRQTDHRKLQRALFRVIASPLWGRGNPFPRPRRAAPPPK